MTFVLPIGFISFYPSCDFLGRNGYSFLPLDMALLTPLIGMTMFVAALWVFSMGLRQYESAGS